MKMRLADFLLEYAEAAEDMGEEAKRRRENSAKQMQKNRRRRR